MVGRIRVPGNSDPGKGLSFLVPTIAIIICCITSRKHKIIKVFPRAHALVPSPSPNVCFTALLGHNRLKYQR